MGTEPKHDPEGFGSTSSMESMSEPEIEHFAQQEHAVVQKRKGGRKPIYATSEERKQRNRQAQAAFRERRTEYIKQLETTIKHHEDTLQSVQQGHRSSNDECMMLRYRVSIYERILHEKGVDISAEMHARGIPNHASREGAPLPGPPAQAPALQRAIMNRHHQARTSPGRIPLKMEPTQLSIPTALRSPGRYQNSTSPSQASSSSSTSPAYVTQGGVLTPPASDHALQHRPAPIGSVGNGARTTAAPHMTPLVTSPGGVPRSSGSHVRPSSFYPSPFQNHIDQLEQEYDAQADLMVDHDQPEHSAGPEPYPQSFHPQQPQPQHPSHPSQAGPPSQPYPSGQVPSSQAVQSDQQLSPVNGMNELYGPGQSQAPPNQEQYGMWQNMQSYPPPFSFPPTSSMR